MISLTAPWRSSRANPLSEGGRLLRFLARIWHVKGTLALPVGQSNEEAFDRLDPLFRQSGTHHERAQDRLTFWKKNPAAQDKMSVFNSGVLHIDRSGAEPVLYYHLTSRPLLFCFLAPLLFLAFAQMTVTIGKLQAPSVEDASKKSDEDKALPQNPIDKFLGAPAPENPKKDRKDSEDKDDKPSPTPAYVFAGIFAALYAGGRILEERLVRKLFRKKLLGS